MHHPIFKHPMLKQLLAGGAALLAIGLLIDFQRLPSFGSKKNVTEACQTTVQPKAKLSREQLARLLAVPEGQKKQLIQEIVKEPYCKLATVQIRAGANAERLAYPLEFDPQNWLIILYEGEQYAGYRFSIR